ncbi:MAG: 3-keto-5-aminohexanoate cleavage protein [Candidatus Helarchaeota archaeon]
MEDKVIITAAITGSIPSKKNNPNIPYTPEEVAEEAYKSYLAGASIIHLHARNPETGAPISGKESVPIFKEYLKLIKEKCDIICQITTGGGATTISGLNQLDRIKPVIECKPEMASLNTGSLNFGTKVFPNPPELIETFAKTMQDLNIKPELEVYELGHIESAKKLIIEKQYLNSPPQFSLVLGTAGGIPATPKNLLIMKEALPVNCTWQVIAIGKHQIPLGTMGIIMGGNIRVGFEDNVYLEKGVLASSNSELVGKIARIIRELGKKVADVSDAREILSLKK